MIPWIFSVSFWLIWTKFVDHANFFKKPTLHFIHSIFVFSLNFDYLSTIWSIVFLELQVYHYFIILRSLEILMLVLSIIINFSLMASLIVSQTFWYTVFSFSFNPSNFFKLPLWTSLARIWFTRVYLS